MSNRKPKILVLAHSPYAGGAELALKSLIGSLADTYEWTVVIPSLVKIDAKACNSGVTYKNIPLPWWCYESHDSPPTISKSLLDKNLAKLKRLVAESDLLLTNTLTIPWLGLLAPIYQKPHIWYVHEFGDIDHGLQFIAGYKETLKLISACSARVLTISEAVRRHLAKTVPESQIDIIHQSIDLQNLIKLPIRKKISYRCVCIGAIKPSKGQIIAAEAMQKVRNKSLTLDIIGPNANDMYVRALLSSQFERVTITPSFSNLNDILSSHDIVLMCSENEAFGRVTIEAMAAGKVVVGFASPATRALLANGRGILYSPNTSNSLSVALDMMDVRTVDRVAARRYVVETFNEAQQAEDFKKSVKKALNTTSYSQDASSALSDYLKLLETNQLVINTPLLLSNTREIRIKAISFLPRSVKVFFKRVLFHKTVD